MFTHVPEEKAFVIRHVLSVLVTQKPLVEAVASILHEEEEFPQLIPLRPRKPVG